MAETTKQKDKRRKTMSEKQSKHKFDKNRNKNDSKCAQKESDCGVENNQTNQRNFRRVMSLLKINDELRKEILELKKKDCIKGLPNNKCENLTTDY